MCSLLLLHATWIEINPLDRNFIYSLRMQTFYRMNTLNTEHWTLELIMLILCFYRYITLYEMNKWWSNNRPVPIEMPLHFACYKFVFFCVFISEHRVQSDTEFIAIAIEIPLRMESDLWSINLNREIWIHMNEYWSLVAHSRRRKKKKKRKFHCQLVVLKESNINNNTIDHYERKEKEEKKRSL